MTYLVTTEPDTDDAFTFEADEDEFHLILASLGDEAGAYHLRNGEAILIRRADYLDIGQPVPVVSEHPKLRLIQGGLT